MPRSRIHINSEGKHPKVASREHSESPFTIEISIKGVLTFQIKTMQLNISESMVQK